MTVETLIAHNTAEWARAVEELAQSRPEPELSMIPPELKEVAGFVFRHFRQAVRAGYCSMSLWICNEKALRYQDVLVKCFVANGLQAVPLLVSAAKAQVNLEEVVSGVWEYNAGGPRLCEELKRHLSDQDGITLIDIRWSKRAGPRHNSLFFFDDPGKPATVLAFDMKITDSA